MKNMFSEMLRHPIATMLIVSSVGTALAGVIGAARGISVK